MAVPWPPPTHLDSRPIVLSRSSSALSRVVMIRDAGHTDRVASAMASPLTFSLSQPTPSANSPARPGWSPPYAPSRGPPACRSWQTAGPDRRPGTAAAGAKAARTTLTHTEVQLVQLLRQGLANRQISAVLHYRAKAIEVCMSRLCQKAGCHSRLELVLMAERGQQDLSPDVRVPPRRRCSPRPDWRLGDLRSSVGLRPAPQRTTAGEVTFGDTLLQVGAQSVV
jgi:DNA-binding CsgD family transcriptional regulator